MGARPQFGKLAPMVAAFASAGIEHVIVHTGQHYDAQMSDASSKGLSIPPSGKNRTNGYRGNLQIIYVRSPGAGGGK